MDVSGFDFSLVIECNLFLFDHGSNMRSFILLHVVKFYSGDCSFKNKCIQQLMVYQGDSCIGLFQFGYKITNLTIETKT